MEFVPLDFKKSMINIANQTWYSDPAISSGPKAWSCQAKSFPSKTDIVSGLKNYCSDQFSRRSLKQLGTFEYVENSEGNNSKESLAEVYYTFETFMYYDLPILSFLQIKKQLENNTIISLTDFPGLALESLSLNEFQELLIRRIKNKKLTSTFPFDVHFVHSVKNFPEHLQLPKFCFNARISAYCRFIIDRERKSSNSKNVHSIPYQLRGLFYHPNFDKGIDIKHNSSLLLYSLFSIEDAWFYEMCTGLCLTAEITAFILELDQKSKKHSNSVWETNRCDIFIDILRKHQEDLISAPAVTWRYTFCRNAFQEIDLVCQNLSSIPEPLLSYLLSPNRFPGNGSIELVSHVLSAHPEQSFDTFLPSNNRFPIGLVYQNLFPIPEKYLTSSLFSDKIPSYEPFKLKDTKECYATVANSIFSRLLDQESYLLIGEDFIHSQDFPKPSNFFKVSNKILCSIALHHQGEPIPTRSPSIPPNEQYLDNLFSSIENTMINLVPTLIRNSPQDTINSHSSKVVSGPFFSFCCRDHAYIDQILQKEQEYRDHYIRPRVQSLLETTFAKVHHALYPNGYYDF